MYFEKNAIIRPGHKQMSAMKEGFIMRLQCTTKFSILLLILLGVIGIASFIINFKTMKKTI